MPQVHPVVYYQPVGVRETEGIVPGIHVGEPHIVVGIVEVRDVKYRASANPGMATSAASTPAIRSVLIFLEPVICSSSTVLNPPRAYFYHTRFFAVHGDNHHFH